MRIGPFPFGVRGEPRLRIALPEPASLKAFRGGTRSRQAELRRLSGLFVDARATIERTGGAAGTHRPRRLLGLLSARSAGVLGLSLESTSATLESSEEVNAVPTSFSPFGPSFGSSSTLPTIGGVYDGAQGDDTLTFEVTRDGFVGWGRVKLEVRDGGGEKIETVNVSRNYSPGSPISLSNGLSLSLSFGYAQKGDSFTVAVSQSIGSRVDPTKPFDGTRNQDPNFEPGLSVGAGSFDVNGVSIAVGAGDTLDAVLQRVTASQAGITATFDSLRERVVLTQKTGGSAPPITLANDTSGFLTATKLAGAEVVPGTDDDLRRPIVQVPALAGISSGFFEIDGTRILVDVAVDTLDDVLARIGTSTSGVSASFDPAANGVVLTASRALTLSDGTSGFFSGLAVPTGSFTAATGGAGRSLGDRDAFARTLRELVRDVNRVFAGSFAGALQGHGLSGAVRDTLASALRAGMADGSDASALLRSGLGLDADLRAPGEVLRIDQARLDRVLREEPEALLELLLGKEGSESEGGLLAALDAALEVLVQRTGPALDLFA